MITSLLVVLANAAASGGEPIDIGTTLVGFGVAAPAIGMLVYLLARSDRRAETLAAELTAVHQRLFDYQERYGPLLVQVSGTLIEVTRTLEKVLDRMDEQTHKRGG